MFRVPIAVDQPHARKIGLPIRHARDWQRRHLRPPTDHFCDAARVVSQRLPAHRFNEPNIERCRLSCPNRDVTLEWVESNRALFETSEGRLKIDVRGDGGFVIAPGSVYASGAEYLEAGDWSEARDRVPVFWPGWLARRQRPVTPVKMPRPTGEPIARARAYLAAIPRPEIGHGSDAATLYAACRLVRGFGLCAVEAEALLWEWAGDRPGWTRDWFAQKVAHAERYGTEPIGALR